MRTALRSAVLAASAALCSHTLQQHLVAAAPPLFCTLCCHSDPCCARYMRVCADDVRPTHSCISWSIHTSVPRSMSDVALRSITQLPICVQMCHCVLPLLLLLLLLLLWLLFAALFCCRLSKIVGNGKLAAAGWSAFCTVESSASPAGSLVVSAVLFDAGLRMRSGPSYTALKSCAVTALLRIGCIPLSTLPPSSSVLLATKSRPLYSMHQSGGKRSSAGTENQAACLSLGQGGARLRSSSLSAHASLVLLQP
jgi:hypothetical protein